MTREIEMKLSNEQLYRVITCMLDYEKRYDSEALGESLEQFMVRQFQVDSSAHYNLTGLESIEGSDILAFFLAKKRVVTQPFDQRPKSPINAVPVTLLPSVDAIPLMSEQENRQPRSTVLHEHHYYDVRERRGNLDFFWGYIFGRDLARAGSTPPKSQKKPAKKKGASGKDDNADNACNEFIAKVIGAVMFALTIVSSVYLIGEIEDMRERLVHNEGRLYALVSATWLGISAALAYSASTTYVPLLVNALALSGPAGWVMFGVIAGTLTLTAVAHAAVIQFAEPKPNALFEQAFGSTSYIPGDLGRIQLTETEANALEAKQIDPIKARCAIAMIREKMGKDPIVKKWGVRAMFDESERRGDNQARLELIRDIRSGHVDKVELDGVDVSLRPTRSQSYQYTSYGAVPSYNPDASQFANASAPPASMMKTNYTRDL